MSKSPSGERKRRTRQHVIADQSVNHIERFILDEGHAVTRVPSDYGYDLLMMTFDDEGYAETGLIFLQLKASEALTRSGANFAFDLDVRDYNLWRSEQLPVILVLFEAGTRRAYWVHVQRYFADGAKRPRKQAKTVRVLVERRQVFGRRAVRAIRALKTPVAVRLVEPTDV